MLSCKTYTKAGEYLNLADCGRGRYSVWLPVTITTTDATDAANNRNLRIKSNLEWSTPTEEAGADDLYSGSPVEAMSCSVKIGYIISLVLISAIYRMVTTPIAKDKDSWTMNTYVCKYI